ncbi:MAG: Rubrerythrin [Elusimicrobia bacterium ADurb.Bin231]|nr:MAG: Rubrerythrin [Elusimicrobia bacterium ADurb.Bin231]
MENTMAEVKNIVEILQVGISRETEANVFYNLLSQYVQDSQISQLCKELAGEELEHRARLELEITKLGRTSKASDSKGNPNLMPLDYMVNMSDIIHMDYEDLLILAMRKEKESFRFYVELLSLVSNNPLREVIIELAEEEARHKIRFEIQYDMYISNRKNPPE